MPEKPLSSDDGSLAQFAEGLRQLRRRADISYRDLARRVGVSPSALSQAASGRKLPTWKVTQAFVKGCGGDEKVWYQQWYQVQRELNSRQVNTPNGQVLQATPTGGTADDAAAGDRRSPALSKIAVWLGAAGVAVLLSVGAAILIAIVWDGGDQRPAAKPWVIPTYVRGDLQGNAGLYRTPRPAPEEIASPNFIVRETSTPLNIVCQVSNGALMTAVVANYAGSREEENDVWYRISPFDFYIAAVYTTYPFGVENKLPPDAPYGTTVPECRNVPP